jgi:hypothetical protein
MYTMLCRYKALAGCPTDWKAVTMCGHLHEAFCGVS